MKFFYCPPTKIDISYEDQFICFKRINKAGEEETVVYNKRLISFFFSVTQKCFEDQENTDHINIRVDGTKIPIMEDVRVIFSPVSVNFDGGSKTSRVTVKTELFMFEIFFTS